jgi:ubiquinone/menaquinone biosynthesis C-methylase UbiE
MSCHGGFSLDEYTRRSWFNPEKVLEDAGLRSGMVFVDVGSGDGFFTILAAQVVGEKGAVYAVDTDASAIERLRGKADEKGSANVKAVVAEAEETVFCEGCADVVFYSMVLHDFHDPAKVLQNAKRMLKPSGKLVDLDWKKKRMSFGPPVQIRFSEEQASAFMNAAGFTIESARTVGPHHYVVTATPAKSRLRGSATQGASVCRSLGQPATPAVPESSRQAARAYPRHARSPPKL